MENFSLLISVYKNEKAVFFKECFDSIYNQTVLPTEIILVEDGPLTKELYDAIDVQCRRFNNIKRVPLKTNCGLGVALRKGMEYCSYDIIARMDTDDICVSKRFEKQLSYMCAHPETDVVSSWIQEFNNTPDNVISVRRLPEYNKDIYEFGKIRNPVNHPTVMFRKKSVEECGGYLPFPQFEDYYLWARMLYKGYVFYNIQQSLLLFRSSPEMMKRRGGHAYGKNEIMFQKTLFRMGYIGYVRMVKNIMIRYGVRVVPNFIRNWIYCNFLRN